MEDTTLDDARYQFEVNLFGLARLTRLALPYMRDRGAGKIVNISSVGGKIYTPLGAWYHESGGGSPASLIAGLIAKSIRARRPRPRYAAGKYAKPMLAVRKWLGDRVFDRVVMSQF
jgi:NAD(P)-dependent dehydrogenase (short-subunit alcohol dehydrogenase family)